MRGWLTGPRLAQRGRPGARSVVDARVSEEHRAALENGVVFEGRVAGAFSTVNYGVRPIGALVGGMLATVIGLRTTLITAAAGGALSLLWLLPSPIPRIRSLALIEPVLADLGAEADSQPAPR